MTHKTSMEKWVLVFLAMFNLKAFAQDTPDSWIGIDCGANKTTTTNGILWQSDENFIQTGTNHLIPNDNIKRLPILYTLRVFTQQNKNCYTLPAQTTDRYFLRAVFFYANYDGLLKPPSFDLQIDGNRWVTVFTSSTKVSYYEILYTSQRPNISVCLARTQNDQFPLISSLEAWKIPNTMYTGMSQDLAWLNSYRYNYGPTDEIIWYPGDSYNRIWEPMSVPDAINTTTDNGTEIYDHSDESPPDSAILDAIEAENGTSLFLSFNPVKAGTPIYVEAYFTEMQSASSGTRSFVMYVDDNPLDGDVIPEYNTCSTKWTLVQDSNSTLTIELRPTESTALSPIISAIEIYTASDPLITSGTDPDDLNGLAAFTGTFDQLKGWSGEPCLPEDTVWQWLSCRRTNPPRVTSINLSEYGLNGNLSDFSQMQALEEIDLSKNRISGQIPEFLGQLPNLKKLDLSYNDFSGTLPSSIRDNRGLTYSITGNPNVNTEPSPSGEPPGGTPPSKHKSKTMFPTTTTVIVIVIVIVLAVASWFIRKRLTSCRKPNGPNPATKPETGNVSGPDSTITSMDPFIRPPRTQTYDDVISVGEYEQSMAPEVDFDELGELVNQQANVNSTHASSIDIDQSMQSDSDVEEIDDIVKREKGDDRK